MFPTSNNTRLIIDTPTPCFSVRVPPSPQENSVFQHATPASAFESAEFSNNFFKDTTCFRMDQSLCYQEGHVYYEVSRSDMICDLAGDVI